MDSLALLWDGAWLRWLAPSSSEVAQREISRKDMVPEVLRALRNQVGSGTQVVAAEWGVPCTLTPEALTQEVGHEEVLVQAHRLHHGLAVSDDHIVHHMLMEDIDPACRISVSGSADWAQALDAIFPQAQRVSVAQALMQDALHWNRTIPHQGWSLRVDVQEQGAHMVAFQGEQIQWVHHLPQGAASDDVLYAMVNACHRGGGEVKDARIRWSGDAKWTEGWSRFFDVERQGSAEGWLTLFESLSSCA